MPRKRGSDFDPRKTPGPPESDTARLGVPARTKAGRAYRQLRCMILRCELPPGGVIQEALLMDELGLGRTPIREALLHLASERLVLFRSNQIQIAPIGADEIRDLFEMRMHNERMAARLFSRRITPEMERALDHSFDGAEALMKEGRINDLVNLDFEFHSMIYRGSRNAFLAGNLYNLFGHSYRLWWLTNRGGEADAMTRIVDSHDPIIDAIKRRDELRLDATIARHISESLDYAMSVLKGSGLETIKDLTPQPFGSA